jgi:hypothetical protein
VPRDRRSAILHLQLILQKDESTVDQSSHL